LDNVKQTPLQRLKTLCENRRKDAAAQHCKKGCLIGKLSQEMAEQNELFRERLDAVLCRSRKRFASCISEGQKLGQITSKYDASELAEFFLGAWDGAVMRSKTLQCTDPQKIFIKIMFDELMKP